MTENRRETGVRVPKEVHRASQTDQNAALPRDPYGAGLSQPPAETHNQTKQSDQAGSMANPPQSDARGQYAKTQHGGDNNGVASAEPVVISGKKSGDATFKHTYKGIDIE